MRISDWSSDVCSSDLVTGLHLGQAGGRRQLEDAQCLGLPGVGRKTPCLLLLFRGLLGEEAEAVAERSVAALTVRLPGMERPTRALPARIAPAAGLGRGRGQDRKSTSLNTRNQLDHRMTAS